MTGEITRVGVVGCGIMGAGIAELCARAGLDVRVAARTSSSIDAGRGRLRRSLDHGVRKELITATERDDALRRVSFTTELIDLADRELIIEAVAENEDIKTEIFMALDKIIESPDAILATNTSSIPIIKLGRATTRAGQVIGIHFFNPVTRMPLAEVVESLLTDSSTTSRVEQFLSGVLGKKVVRSRDRAGFVVNVLLIPYLLSAIRMLESGFAPAADIDKAMRLGCAHPMGPLELVDMIGLDVIVGVAEALHAEFREPHYSPPPLLLRMVDAGLLGKKTGRGFHDYTS